MLVILDANVLIADFPMEGNAFRILSEEGERAGILVGLPDVVAREAIRKLRQRLDAELPRLAKLKTELRQLLVDVEHAVDSDQVVSGYENRLRSLAALPGWASLPLPDVPHAQILDRLHSEGAPARGNGVGYQDILVWETLKANLDRDPHVVLVSADGDFAGPDGRLDAALSSEISRDQPSVRVELVRSLKAFVEEYIAVNRVDAFWQGLDRDRRTDFEHSLAEHLVGMYLSADLRQATLPGAHEAWIAGVLDMSDVEIHDAQMLSNGQIAFEMVVDASVAVEADRSLNDPTTPSIHTYFAVTAEARWDPVTGKPTYVKVLAVEHSG